MAKKEMSCKGAKAPKGMKKVEKKPAMKAKKK